ncbi:DUF397 domain-containing protein [Streptomyces prunicolor]|uniref:DUF397 domain-containing protein n=1 Tax=Streptomyces prunicolor TaxID=67348 RepID=UPI00386968A5|nr:DUF397 domain-containing protein [Streptomyces prunicolor]
MTTETPRWFTSSYSDNGGACIEVAANLVAPRGTVPVRDSKNPTGPVLGFRAGVFTSFIAGVKAGKFGTV